MMREINLWLLLLYLVLCVHNLSGEITCFPAIINENNPETDSIEFELQSSFEENFNPEWETRNDFWRVASWEQNGTQMSPERCVTNEDGHLVQTVLPGEPYRGGSLQTSIEFGYGRWVARVCPSTVPGVLNSIFTKDWGNLETETSNDGTKYEVDIEFLTHTFGPDTGSVHIAIHKKNYPNVFEKDIPLDFNPSEDFHEWGFDILPDKVVWHVDGNVLETWESPAGESIPAGYEFFFNSWTKEQWIQGPPEDTAYYYIDYLRFFKYKSIINGIGHHESQLKLVPVYPNPFNKFVKFPLELFSPH